MNMAFDQPGQHQQAPAIDCRSIGGAEVLAEVLEAALFDQNIDGFANPRANILQQHGVSHPALMGKVRCEHVMGE
jgi:hypothetical protein